MSALSDQSEHRTVPPWQSPANGDTTSEQDSDISQYSIKLPSTFAGDTDEDAFKPNLSSLASVTENYESNQQVDMPKVTSPALVTESLESHQQVDKQLDKTPVSTNPDADKGPLNDTDNCKSDEAKLAESIVDERISLEYLRLNPMLGNRLTLSEIKAQLYSLPSYLPKIPR